MNKTRTTMALAVLLWLASDGQKTLAQTTPPGWNSDYSPSAPAPTPTPAFPQGPPPGFPQPYMPPKPPRLDIPVQRAVVAAVDASAIRIRYEGADVYEADLVDVVSYDQRYPLAFNVGDELVLASAFGTPIVGQGQYLTYGPNGDGFLTDTGKQVGYCKIKDPRSDLVWENVATGEHMIWVMIDGHPTGQVINLPRTSPDWRIVAVADIIGDGNADLVWENIHSGQHLIWLFKNHALTGKIINLPTMPLSWHLAGCGHFGGVLFAGDSIQPPRGQVDLVWENTSTGERVIWLMDRGVPTTGVKLPTADPTWRIVATPDRWKGQQSDLMFQNAKTNDVIEWFMAGATPFGSFDVNCTGMTWQIAGTADFYGSGGDDWIFQNTSTGQSQLPAPPAERGPSGRGPTTLPTVPPSWHIVNH